MYDIEKIKQESDLISIAEMAGAKFHRAGSEWRSHCPLHGGDNQSGFAVFDNDTRWACFTKDCGSGDVIEFVEKWRGISFQEACDWLGGNKESDPLEIARIAEDRVQKQIERLEEEQRKTEMLLRELKEAQNWIRYSEALENSTRYQTIWESQGIPRSWQTFWQLGYCENFTARSGGQLFHSPSLTIPIFENGEIRNIRHRLLNPIDPHDKYRPERPGLSAIPFYADNEAMYDKEFILYVEGEKKAMVTFLTLDSPKWQVIGIPGKNQWKQEVSRLSGQKVITLFDPDALDEAREFARLVKGHYMELPYKIDDLIVEMNLEKRDLMKYMRGARRA